MRIAIIGAGKVGGGLAAAAVEAGHEVVIAAAHHDHAVEVAARTGASAAATSTEAAAGADVVVLAVPAGAAAGVLGELAATAADTVVVDVTNPIDDTATGLTTVAASQAERLAEAAPGVPLVKAFNTIFAARLGAPDEGGRPLDGYYAGDDEAAKQTVATLLTSLGFRPVDVGGLRMARSLEGMALLNISLNIRNGWPWQSGWRLAGPTS